MWIFSQTNNILLLNIFLNYNCRNNEQHSFLDQPSKTAQKVFLKVVIDVQMILYCQFNSAFHSVTQGGIFCVGLPIWLWEKLYNELKPKIPIWFRNSTIGLTV